MSQDGFLIVVQFEKRPDGGLRAWSEALPELVLSGASPEAVRSDIPPALEAILEAKLGYKVKVGRIDPIEAAPPSRRRSSKRVNYAALVA